MEKLSVRIPMLILSICYTFLEGTCYVTGSTLIASSPGGKQRLLSVLECFLNIPRYMFLDVDCSISAVARKVFTSAVDE